MSHANNISGATRCNLPPTLCNTGTKHLTACSLAGYLNSIFIIFIVIIRMDWEQFRFAYVSNPFSTASTSQLWCRLIADTKPPDGTLHEAAATGDLETMEELLDDKKDLDLDEMDEDGKTAIHHALRAGSPEIVWRLLDAGASPNPLSLPPPSVVDGLIILFRVLGAVLQWVLIFWIVSKLVSVLGIPMFPVTVIRRYVKFKLILWLGLGKVASYIFATVWLIKVYPHFRQDSIAEAAASFKGDSEQSVLILIDSGYYCPLDYERLILWEDSVTKGQTGVCQRLLDMGLSVDTPFVVSRLYEDPAVVTALHYASGASHLELVSLLLARGADASLLDSRGWSCLQLACMGWYPSANDCPVDHPDAVLKLLLNTNAIEYIDKIHFQNDPDTNTSVFQTKLGWPLAAVCKNLRPSAVKLLLDAGAKPNLADEMGTTALHVAAGVCYDGRYLDSVRFLLEAGAEVSSTTTDGWTALGNACNAGVSPQVMTILLEAGADPSFGAGINTPLQIAARHDVLDLQIVRILLATGVDVNATGGTYGTALVAGLNKPKHADGEPGALEFVAEMINRGADVNLAPEGYEAPITAAATHDWPRVVQQLIGHGAVIPPTQQVGLSEGEGKRKWARNILSVSVLSYLDQFGSQPEVFAILLNHGASPNGDTFFSSLSGTIGYTILGNACKFSSPEVAALLLAHGADPNALDCKGRHPLHNAAYAVSFQHISLLFQHGASLSPPMGCNHREYGTPWHSLCKGISNLTSASRDSEKVKEFQYICELLAAYLPSGISVEDMIFGIDADGKNCLHHLMGLCEETKIVLRLKPSRSPFETEAETDVEVEVEVEVEAETESNVNADQDQDQDGGGDSGADADAEEKEEDSAWDSYPSTSESLNLISVFLTQYCSAVDPSSFLARDSAGQTVFQIAAKAGDTDIMALLLRHVLSLGGDTEKEKAVTALLEVQGEGIPLVLAYQEKKALAIKFLTEVYAFFVDLGEEDKEGLHVGDQKGTLGLQGYLDNFTREKERIGQLEVDSW